MAVQKDFGPPEIHDLTSESCPLQWSMQPGSATTEARWHMTFLTAIPVYNESKAP